MAYKKIFTGVMLYIGKIGQIGKKTKISAVLLVIFQGANCEFYRANRKKARKTGTNALDKKIGAFCAFMGCGSGFAANRKIGGALCSARRGDLLRGVRLCLSQGGAGWYFCRAQTRQRGGARSLKYIPKILTFL